MFSDIYLKESKKFGSFLFFSFDIKKFVNIIYFNQINNINNSSI